MGKNVADIKLTANSGIELPLPNPKDVKKVLILGNTIGFFGYPGEGCNISNIHGEDAKRFAWMYNCALLGVEIEILGEEEEFEYYSDLFRKIRERYGLEADATFVEMKKNEDYDTALETYIDEMEDTGKKRFDYAIMNPPYDRNLHLKFLEKVIKVAGKTVNISPVRWLQDPFAPYVKGSDLLKFEDSVAKKIESLEIIDAKQGSKLFDVSFAMNIGIYVCSDKGGYSYSHRDSIIRKIVDKTLESNWEPYNMKSFVQSGAKCKKPYILNIAPVRMNESDDKVYITCRCYENQLKVQVPETDQGVCGGHFEFDTEEERRNFYDCYASPFMLYTYKLWKTNAKTFSKKVPYFGDYTKPWTNARFCEYFGITGFVSDTEAEPGSEWETILETMKKYA